MGESKDDIEKYLRGDMSPAEMHALEKRALSDPFLADALEGGNSISQNEFSQDLADLRKRLPDRDSKKVLPIWVWPARIAAGIALVGLISYIVITQSRETSENRIAQNNTTPKPAEEKPLTPIIEEQSDSAGTRPNAGSDAVPKPAPKEKVAKQPEDDVESDNIRREELATASEAIGAEEGENSAGIVERDDHPPTAILQEAPVASPPLAGYTDEMSRLEQSVQPRKRKVISGTVIDAEDGRAMPGVNVMIEGTPIGTITNEEGKYVISTDSLEADLQFSFIGYENKVIDGAVGNVDVMLNPDVAELSEVVVVGYGGTKREDTDIDPIIEMAEPAGGRKAFKQYLTENLRYPEQALNNKVEGRVTVQFTIDPAGKMSDFKVLKGLGYGCDEEVIRLIRQGPKWRPSRRNTEPVADKVKVRMKFSLPRK